MSSPFLLLPANEKKRRDADCEKQGNHFRSPSPPLRNQAKLSADFVLALATVSFNLSEIPERKAFSFRSELHRYHVRLTERQRG